MVPSKLRGFFLSLVIALSLIGHYSTVAFARSCPSAFTHFWYQDNTLVDENRRIAKDFDERYVPEKLKQWEEARGSMGVYMIPPIRLLSRKTKAIFSDSFLQDRFLPAVRASGTRLAYNVTGAKRGARKNIQAAEMGAMERIVRLGGSVDYVAFQSALSKGSRRNMYPIDKAIAEVVDYAVEMHKTFPQVRLGIIDALLAHRQSYEGPYRDLQKALEAKGLKLDFIILDMSVDLWYRTDDRRVTFEDVKNAVGYIQKTLGAQAGLLLTSRAGGETSSQEFHGRVLRAYQDFLDAGGSADFYLLTSWFRFPDYSAVPNNSIPMLQSFTDLVSTYCEHVQQ